MVDEEEKEIIRLREVSKAKADLKEAQKLIDEFSKETSILRKVEEGTKFEMLFLQQKVEALEGEIQQMKL